MTSNKMRNVERKSELYDKVGKEEKKFEKARN